MKIFRDEHTVRSAIAQARNRREALEILGVVPEGGNYRSLARACRAFHISTDHLFQWYIRRTLNPRPRRALQEVLAKGSFVQSHKLKNRLFRENILAPQCILCGWNKSRPDGTIPVELDHINGDHSDNRLENLRILCPNCHSLQATHRGKNKKNGPVAEWYTRDT